MDRICKWISSTDKNGGCISDYIFSILCTWQVSYTLHKNKYEQNRQVDYTEYCDSEGNPIPIDAKVFYKGKKYEVVKYNGIYRLLPYGDKMISSALIKLEDAASDIERKLLLQKWNNMFKTYKYWHCFAHDD